MKLVALVEIYIYLASFTSFSWHHLVFYENQTFLTINEKKTQNNISIKHIFFEMRTCAREGF